ncbi:MAG: hypothetical protein GX575_19250 [Candidatus Anammoximicrobium sp.]|nr:hypothetical protein [Candidatus Anammoximicrobium sp.]
MHDRTRRWLCRLGFLLLGVAPTLGVVTWITVVRSPAYVAACKAECEDRLSAALGLAVSVEQMHRLLQGVTLLDGVVLTEPETDSPIARIRHLEFGRRDGRWIVLASQPEIEGPQVWRLWESLHERVLRVYPAAGAEAEFYANEMTIRQADGQTATTLTDVRSQLTTTDAGPQATIEFRDVALQMSEPAQLRITRNRQVRPPATRWALNTRSTALPCAVLADYLQTLRTLGEQATFQGTIEAMPAAEGWEGEIVGRFRDVDLDRVTQCLKHKLSGSAEILFRRATFRAGRLIDAAGDVTCNGGVVSRSLLYQANKSLGLVADSRLLTPQANALLLFRELKLGFTLDKDGIQIAGQCPSASPGVVMTDEDGPLLSNQSRDAVQVTALVRTLAPDTGEHVPANYEAYQLLHVLPIPSDAGACNSEIARPVYSPLRLH